MSVQVDIIPGPAVAEVSRETAERGLRSIASRRKAASYSLEQSNGQWIGALAFEAKTAADNPFGGSDDDSSPAPSDGPDDSAPADAGSDDGGSDDSPAGPPSGDSDSDSGEKKDKGKGGEDHLLHQVMDALTQIGEALGVPLNLGDSPVPGLDAPDGPPGGPAGPPPGGPAGGPPGAPPSSHGDKFPKPMKPGEAPPGVPPIGTPAFSSVNEDHPFAHMAGKVASFKAQRPIGDRPMPEVVREVTALANQVGYNAYVKEARDADGNRIADCLITVHQQ